MSRLNRGHDRNSFNADLASDSGPYLLLMAEAVRLARTDLDDPEYSDEARAFLKGDLVQLFSECIGYRGGFIG